jgi:hypothetical protein
MVLVLSTHRLEDLTLGANGGNRMELAYDEVNVKGMNFIVPWLKEEVW